MDIDKKTILAFILIGLVIILTQSDFYRKTFFPKSYQADKLRKEQRAKKLQELAAGKDSEQIVSEQLTPSLDRALPASKKSKTLEPASQGIFQQRIDAQERLIEVNTPLIEATISTRGATIVNWRLKNYVNWDGSLVEMIPPEAEGNLGISFSTLDTTVDTSPVIFDCSTDVLNIYKGEQASVKFELKLDENRRIVKRFTFSDNRYDFEVKVELENMGDIIAGRNYEIGWKSGLAATEQRLNDDMYYAKAYVSATGSTEQFKKTDGEIQTISGQNIDWTAVRTKYFVAAIAPKDRKGLEVRVKGEALPTEKKKEKWKKFSVDLRMPFLNDDLERDSFIVYCGPLDYDIIREYGLGFESMMDFGWKIIEPFSKAVLWSLKKIHIFVSNYGLVLIIFSILIKIIVYPLTHKSYQSMQKMQGLQPLIAELKEKYGKDPQRLNKETMKLYKEYGVNPLGGCLPMLLQMPLLYSLFIIFRATIELRGAGFVWWIKDLSSPDTIATLPFEIPLYGDCVNVLPLLMGATMFLQQKMSMQDPKQKMMAYMMPIFFTLLFNSFPSGLTLYYTLFNVLSIAQQKLISDKNKIQPVVVKKPVQGSRKASSARRKRR